MGGSSTTSTSQTGSASPVVTENVDKLVGKVGGLSDKDYPVFNKSLYPGLSSTSQGGIQGLLNASNNGIYTGGVNSALDYSAGMAGGSGPSLTESTLMDVAQGNRFGENAPGYATLRNNVRNDTLTDINAMFSNSGRLGSGMHVDKAAEGVGNALAGLDYTNYQNDIGRQERALGSIEGQRQQGVANTFAAQQSLPGLLQASTAPAQMQLTAGGLLDADKAAKLQGDQDLFMRKNLADYTQLGQLSSILAGTAPSAGTVTTQTEPAPNPWLGALGAGLALL